MMKKKGVYISGSIYKKRIIRNRNIHKNPPPPKPDPLYSDIQLKRIKIELKMVQKARLISKQARQTWQSKAMNTYKM